MLGTTPPCWVPHQPSTHCPDCNPVCSRCVAVPPIFPPLCSVCKSPLPVVGPDAAAWCHRFGPKVLGSDTRYGSQLHTADSSSFVRLVQGQLAMFCPSRPQFEPPRERFQGLSSTSEESAWGCSVLMSRRQSMYRQANSLAHQYNHCSSSPGFRVRIPVASHIYWPRATLWAQSDRALGLCLWPARPKNRLVQASRSGPQCRPRWTSRGTTERCARERGRQCTRHSPWSGLPDRSQRWGRDL